MKNLLRTSIVLLIFSFVLFSCEKNTNTASILGKWNLLHKYEKNNLTDLESYRTGSYINFSEDVYYAYYAEEGDPFNSYTASFIREGNKLKFTGNESWEITKVSSNELTFDVYYNAVYELTLVLKK